MLKIHNMHYESKHNKWKFFRWYILKSILYPKCFDCELNYWGIGSRCISNHQIVIPHARSCGGYNVFDPSVSQSVCLSGSQSVSQSVSPVFLVSTTPLKPLNRISWNFVVMKDIMCRCAYPQEILNPLFFAELRPFWT